MPCRTFWQLDYAETAPDGEWNIVAPGPSLERTIGEVQRRRPSIAVEGALRAPLPFGFWSCWGRPRPSHAAAWSERGLGGPMYDADLVVLTGMSEGYNKARRVAWHTWMAEQAGGDPLIALSDPRDPTPALWADARLDRGPSWLAAIRFAVLRGAARRVFLYGLDLDGEGYAFGWPSSMRRDPEDWAGRWVSERALLERAKQTCEAVGVELVRAG